MPAYPALFFDFLHLCQHVFVRRTDFVIHFDELPLDNAFAVNHVSRRMRNRAAGFVIEQSVTVNHAMVCVRQQREIKAGFVFQLVAQKQGFVVRINADGQNFDFILVLFFE